MDTILLTDTFSPINEGGSFVYKPMCTTKYTSMKMDEALDLTLSSSFYKSSDVDSPILGVFEGCFFKANSHSSNGRYYTKELWESVLSKSYVKNALLTGSMFGVMEHPSVDNYFTKDGLITGAHPIYAAFITKKLWLDGDIGYGRAYVLNSPAGRMVHVLSTCKDEEGNNIVNFSMSSRANGKLSSIMVEGSRVVDPNSYFFIGFDGVLNPGIKGATPTYTTASVKEAIKESVELSIKSLSSLDRLKNKFNIKSLE